MTLKIFTPIPSDTPEVGVVDTTVRPSFQTALPVSGSESGVQESRWFPPLVVIPSVPKEPSEEVKDFSGALRPRLVAIPSEPSFPEPVMTAKFLSPVPSPARAVVAEAPVKIIEKAPVRVAEVAPVRAVESPRLEIQEVISEHSQDSQEPCPFQAAPDFNDADLAEAFTPLMESVMESVMRKSVLENEKDKIDDFLEPMIRATIRRALAEYSPASRPFQQPGFMDRSVWRLQALFSSRTFEDVVFEKTHRFQVEEVFLLDAKTLALVSFASCDPARHSAVKRVEASAKRIALQIRTENGEIQRSIERSDGKNIITEKGENMILVAIVRGSPNDLILADLEFSLRRIEEHFSERFQQAGSALIHALQPFLEDCLLIQAPASAA